MWSLTTWEQAALMVLVWIAVASFTPRPDEGIESIWSVLIHTLGG